MNMRLLPVFMLLEISHAFPAPVGKKLVSLPRSIYIYTFSVSDRLKQKQKVSC